MSSSEVKVEAKGWLYRNKDAEIGSLTRSQSGKLVGALYMAGDGHSSVHVIDPDGDVAGTLHIYVEMDYVARVMARLANYHPDETELMPCDTPGCHIIRAWWD